MRVEIRNDSILIDGYVNAVGRDSRQMHDKKTGEKYVEQIVPGAFKRALTKNEVKLLLDHDETRELGETGKNLELHEDAIGLRAKAEITDPEVIQKAREKKLRGWSFGFYERGASEEETKSGIKRRYIEEMELVEVSIIDEKRLPCYTGTSIETRAEENELLKYDHMEVRAEYVEKQEENKQDYEKYRKRIKELEEK